MTPSPSSGPARPFSDEELEAIRAAGIRREPAEGELLFERDDPGESMFLVDRGEVELTFVDGEPGKVIRAGEVFGELALIAPHHRRSAGAKAGRGCRLWEVDQAAVEKLFAQQPRLLLNLLRRTCVYLLDSESRLIVSLRERNEELQRTLDYLRRTQEEVGAQELLAKTDQLTRLYNRRCLDQQLAKFAERATATGEGLALLLIDLDGFKPVNDTHGHPAGDRVLRSVAGIIRRCVRNSDLPCRFGGDEFAVVLWEVGARQARDRAERVRREVAELLPIEADPELRVTTSIGGTMYVAGESAEAFLARADQYLYRAKNGGKNRVVWADA